MQILSGLTPHHLVIDHVGADSPRAIELHHLYPALSHQISQRTADRPVCDRHELCQRLLADDDGVQVSHLSDQVVQEHGCTGFPSDQPCPRLMGFAFGLDPLTGPVLGRCTES